MRGIFKNGLAVFTLVVLSVGTSPLFADSGQFKLDLIMAKRGDPDAQYYVGMGFEEGRGTKKDVKQAFNWYSQSANQGHQGAQYKLGTFYEFGRGVKKNIKTAIDWYKKASKAGSSLAKERLNKVAFASTEQVMKRRMAARRAEEDKQAARKQRAKERARKTNEKKQAAAKKARSQKVAKKETRPAKQTARADIPDILDVVMKNSWSNSGSPADHLPSLNTNCLKASDKEVVCFSREISRNVNGAKIVYTTKATLSNFSRKGSFKVKYFYNAMKVDKAGKGPRVDPLGLRPEEGWQEPQLSMSCQAANRTSMVCSRGKHRIRYTR